MVGGLSGSTRTIGSYKANDKLLLVVVVQRLQTVLRYGVGGMVVQGVSGYFRRRPSECNRIQHALDPLSERGTVCGYIDRGGVRAKEGEKRVRRDIDGNGGLKILGEKEGEGERGGGCCGVEGRGGVWVEERIDASSKIGSG